MMALTYDTVTDGRKHFSDALKAASEGQTVRVVRSGGAIVLLDGRALLGFIAKATPSKAVIAQDEHGYSVYLPDKPIAADGATVDEALDQMVEAMRTYAMAWHDVLRQAPNHAGNWGLVQLIELSDDDQLRSWLTEDCEY
jgi:predicted RNase H-like HicB family nuclease